MRQKIVRPSLAESETLAAQAFAFLCGERKRAERFMQLTGLDPANLPALAGERSFLAGVLEHMLTDESLLLTFCANHGIEPESIGAAQRQLSGQPAGGPEG